MTPSLSLFSPLPFLPLFLPFSLSLTLSPSLSLSLSLSLFFSHPPSLSLSLPLFFSPTSFRLYPHSISDSSLPLTPSFSPAQVRSQTTSIAIGVTVLLLLIVLAIVVVVGVWGCVIYCKRRDRDLAFSFKYMKDEEDKEALDSQTQNSEDLVDTDEKKLDLGTT